MMRDRQQGFTLVEVLIVIAIIAIMSGVVAPSLLGAIPGIRVSGAARDVLSDFRMARTLAVDRGFPVIVEFDAPSNTHYRMYVDRNRDGSYTSGTDTLVKEVTLTNEYKSIILKSNDGAAPADGVDLDGTGGDSIAFQPNGSASGTGAVYLMPSRDSGGSRNDRNRRVWVVAATGNVRIENYNGSVWQ